MLDATKSHYIPANKFLRCIITMHLIIFFSTIFVQRSFSLELSVVDLQDFENFSENEYILFRLHGHVLRLNGLIQLGSLEKIKTFVNNYREENNLEYYDDFSIIELNSPGGSFKEAIDIANWISDQGIATYVPEGGSCLSACAFVFLGGRQPPFEGPGWVARFLHPLGSLGFHAPFIDGGAFTEEELNAASMIMLRQRIDDFQLGISLLGRLLSGSQATQEQWPPSLLGEALITPPDRYRFIESTDDAGRWGIYLTDIDDRVGDELGAEQLVTACANTIRWSDDESWYAYPTESFEDIFLGNVYSDIREYEIQNINYMEPTIIRAYNVEFDSQNSIGCHIVYSKLSHDADFQWRVYQTDDLTRQEISNEDLFDLGRSKAIDYSDIMLPSTYLVDLPRR